MSDDDKLTPKEKEIFQSGMLTGFILTIVGLTLLKAIVYLVK